jgi:hypothetical protein
MKTETREMLYEQGTNEKLFGIVSFNQLFEQMLLISKGETTVKVATKFLKAEWQLAKKDFDILFYGKFPTWWHEYLVERWSGYIGKMLDKGILTMILEQEITDWDDVFCNQTSFYYMLSAMEDMHNQKLREEQLNARIEVLERQIGELDYRSLTTSTKLETLTK